MKKILKQGMYCATGQMLSIEKVNNGEACNCVCAECGEALIAKQGESNEWHFAHKNGKICVYAPETALHWLAKQIIAEGNMVRLPDGSSFVYTEHQQEAWMPGIRPDIWISDGVDTILVEIVVTNGINEAKKSKILKANLTVLEIDLSDIDRLISKEELKKIIIEDYFRKRIIRKEVETQVEGNNWISYLLYTILAFLLIRLIVRHLKNTFKLKRKYRYGI